jgi:hypothetical protein
MVIPRQSTKRRPPRFCSGHCISTDQPLAIQSCRRIRASILVIQQSRPAPPIVSSIVMIKRNSLGPPRQEVYSSHVASRPTLSATLASSGPALLQRAVFQRADEVPVLVRTHRSALSPSSSDISNRLLAVLWRRVVCRAWLQTNRRVGI